MAAAVAAAAGETVSGGLPSNRKRPRGGIQLKSEGDIAERLLTAVGGGGKGTADRFFRKAMKLAVDKQYDQSRAGEALRYTRYISRLLDPDVSTTPTYALDVSVCFFASVGHLYAHGCFTPHPATPHPPPFFRQTDARVRAALGGWYTADASATQRRLGDGEAVALDISFSKGAGAKSQLTVTTFMFLCVF